MNLPNLPSLSNKVRSSALFITGATSSCFIAEDFLKMSKLEMDQADYMERDACGDPGIDRQSRAGVRSARIRNRGLFLGFRPFGLQPHAPNGNPTKIK
jgi:hypothetical protein